MNQTKQSIILLLYAIFFFANTYCIAYFLACCGVVFREGGKTPPAGSPLYWGCPRGDRCEFAHGEECLPIHIMLGCLLACIISLFIMPIS